MYLNLHDPTMYLNLHDPTAYLNLHDSVCGGVFFSLNVSSQLQSGIRGLRQPSTIIHSLANPLQKRIEYVSRESIVDDACQEKVGSIREV